MVSCSRTYGLALDVKFKLKVSDREFAIVGPKDNGSLKFLKENSFLYVTVCNLSHSNGLTIAVDFVFHAAGQGRACKGSEKREGECFHHVSWVVPRQGGCFIGFEAV